MPENYPGPWVVKLFYSVPANGITDIHELKLSVDVTNESTPGEDMANINVLNRAGAQVSLAARMIAFGNALIELLDDASTVDYYELWQAQGASFVLNYWSTETLGLTGQLDSPPTFDREDIYTFRSQGGGTARLHVLGAPGGLGATVNYPTGTTRIDDMFEFMSAADTIFLARDNGYIFYPLAYHPGANERAFKRRYRP